MATSRPKVERGLLQPGRKVNPAVTACEVLAVYAAILLYIWRWEHVYPFLWLPMLAAVIFTQWFYGDTLEEMGLTGRQFRPCARASFPVLGVVIVIAVIYGLWARDSARRLASPHAWLVFAGYLAWCSFQQYLTQSYFHRRLMKVIHSPHLRSFLVGLLFAGAHIPNPILMVATFLGGFVFAEIFVRHPNVWPLAFVQAVAGLLIGTLSPPGIIHNMRVGPGYFFFHLH
jgi:Type II CAAX prenyl endopeptidase Rce1-like